MRLLTVTMVQLVFWGFLAYAVLCMLTGGCAHAETDHNRGVRLYQTYGHLAEQLKRSCVVLCNLPALSAPGNVEHIKRLSTKVKVKEPQNFPIVFSVGAGPWPVLQMPPVLVPPVATLGCQSPLTIGDFSKLAVEHVHGCLPLGSGATAILLLDGPGSTTNDLFRLLNYLHQYRALGHKVICIVDEEADSGNAYAFESPECDTRIMRPEAKLGIHHLVFSVEDAPLQKVKEWLEQAAIKQAFLYRMIALRIDGGQGLQNTAEALEAQVEAAPDGLLSLDAKEAAAIGLVDAIVPKEKT